MCEPPCVVRPQSSTPSNAPRPALDAAGLHLSRHDAAFAAVTPSTGIVAPAASPASTARRPMSAIDMVLPDPQGGGFGWERLLSNKSTVRTTRSRTGLDLLGTETANAPPPEHRWRGVRAGGAPTSRA